MRISRIFENFKNSSIYKIYRNFQDVPARFYLVGGALRNFALNQDAYDIDIIVLDSDPEKLSKEISKKVKGYPFPILDPEKMAIFPAHMVNAPVGIRTVDWIKSWKV